MRADSWKRIRSIVAWFRLVTMEILVRQADVTAIRVRQFGDALREVKAKENSS